MHIYEVDTNKRRDVNRFVMLPFKLYKDSEQWVPPFLSDARMQLNRQKNPYFKRNDATFFIAEQDGEDVGRICAMHPRFYNEFKGLNNAFFYLFDSVNDQAVANALFDAAAKWASKRGMDVFRGPLGFMAFDGFGILAKGFEYRPAMGIPYNYDYYPKLAENWGFELEERVLSGYIDVVRLRAEFPKRILDIAEKVKKRYGFEIKTFGSKRELRQWVAPRLADLYNRTLTHIAGDPPLSQEEVDLVAQTILPISDPELLKFIMKGEEIVGFALGFPNLAVGMQRARGRLFPFGIIHILREFGRTQWVDFNGMGILPQYQGFGGTAIMYAELYHSIDKFPNFQHGEVIQISELNFQSLNEMKSFGVDFYKVHHIYQKKL